MLHKYFITLSGNGERLEKGVGFSGLVALFCWFRFFPLLDEQLAVAELEANVYEDRLGALEWKHAVFR
jgi:hypothetical protein